MAIFHLSMKVISRANGQNSVASSAYRSGELLIDEQTGEKKFYSRSVQPETYILAPSNSPEWVTNRQKLWNEVERSESRINSRLARELQIALPLELSNENQTILLKDFIQKNCVDLGMVADIAIHRDHAENPHAHIMLTTREISENGFENKNRDWDKKEYLENIRKEWATSVNLGLKKVGSEERIDHRSYAERGLSILPTKHVGVKANAMSEKGIDIDVVKENREIKEYNKKITYLEDKKEEMLRKKYKNRNNENDKLNNDIKEVFERKEMVVPTSIYLYNQSKMAIIYNANEREKKLIANEEKKISKFTEEKMKVINNEKSTNEQIEIAKKEIEEFKKNSKESIKKHQEIVAKHAENLKGLINNKREYIKHAENYLKKTDPTILEFTNQLKKKFDRRHGEILIRYANKIQETKSLDFIEITKNVESDLVFNNVKRLLKGHTDYYSVSKEIKNLNEQEKDTLTPKEKKEISDKLANLTYAKESYETRAVSELMKKGHSDLVSHYWADNADRSHLVKLFETMVKNNDLDSATLEQVTRNNEKIQNGKSIVRSNLNYFSIEYKLKNLAKWHESIRRSDHDENCRDYLQIKKDFNTASANVKLITEVRNILTARVSDYINANVELKSLIREEIKNIPLSDIIDKNIGLYDKFDTLSNKELVSEMQKNMIRFNEEKVMNLAYQVIGSKAKSYESVKEELEKVKASIDFESYDKAKSEKLKFQTAKGIVEDMWNEKENLNSKKFLGHENRNRKHELNQWFENHEITAKSLSGTLSQVDYKLTGANIAINQHERAVEVTVPVLEQAVKAHENVAIRYIEKEFQVNDLFKYNEKISSQDKETFCNLYEFRKENGNLKDKVDLTDIEKNAIKQTEKYQVVVSDLHTLGELQNKQSARYNSLNEVIEAQKKHYESQLSSKDIDKITEAKDRLKELSKVQKSEREKHNDKIAELRLAEQKAWEEKAKLRKGINATRNITKALESVQTTISDAQKDAERRKRLQSLKNEKGDDFGLEMERKIK